MAQPEEQWTTAEPGIWKTETSAEMEDQRSRAMLQDRRTKVDPGDRKKEVEQSKRGESPEVQGGTRKSKGHDEAERMRDCCGARRTGAKGL